MRNVEGLDELSKNAQHAKNAKNKIKNISRIAKSSSGQGQGANRGNVFKGNANYYRNNTYQDNMDNDE
jgi:hypothetical protein